MGLLSIFSQKTKPTAEETTKVDSVKDEKDIGGTDLITTADLSRLLVGSGTSAGVTVSLSSAIQLATVWACVRLLAESIAQLPCHVYSLNKDGSKSRVRDTALAERLSYKPNFWQTPFEYTEFMMTGLTLQGNSYSFVSRDSKGQVMELIPFTPSSVRIKRNGLRNIKYVVVNDGREETYELDEISHVRGSTLDGFRGVSPITHHRETIGLTQVASQYGGKLFKNMARPSGVLKFPGELGQEAYERLKKDWPQTYGGGNIGKTGLLEEGGEYQVLSMSNEDAQYLELRQFQRTEICSIYRIPPHMIGDLTKSSFSNINQQGLEFIKYTILPWCVRIEQAMQRDLMTAEDRKYDMFVEHVVAGLERADIRTRYQAYKEGINGGWLSPNEVRQKENMNPRPGGDIYLTPLNMVDSSQGLPEPKKQEIKAVSLKGVAVREAVRRKFRGRFEKVGRNVVKMETAMVRSLLSEKAVPDNLVEQIDEIYAIFPGRIESSFRTLVREYGVAVRGAAMKETDQDGEVDAAQFETFLDGILEALAVRYTSSSTGQLQTLISDTDPEELVEVIEQRLDEWEEKRPAKIADRETVQQENAVSRFVWMSAGVNLLQWVRRGSKSCPFCMSLDGKVVGINAPFVEQGNYEPEGYEDSPWKVRGPKMHAPIHQGCECAIVPAGE